jgi:hypothetical protein
MRSTPSNGGIADHSEALLDDVEYICIAADLLHLMLVELQSLPVCNSTLARAWSDHGSEAYAHLQTLQETIERLLCIDDRWVAAPLIHRATALISWLSDDINELILCADGDSFSVESSQVIFH